MSVTDDCRIKTDQTTLYPHGLFRSKTSVSLTASGNRENLTDSEILNFIPSSTREKHSNHELDELAYSLPELQKIALLQTRRYANNHLIIGLAITAASFILLNLLHHIASKPHHISKSFSEFSFG
jgi:hypothetical protein